MQRIISRLSWLILASRQSDVVAGVVIAINVKKFLFLFAFYNFLK